MVSGTAELAVETATDDVLLRQFAKTRDEAAFTELVRRHGRLVWGVCRRRLARREDAEDAFQAAFLILAVKAHAIHSADALPGWLHRTACRAAIRVASASPVEATHDVPTDSLDAFAEVTRREAATAIDEELVRLPERYRNAVVLFHLEGLERRDVAERLGISEPTVKALLSRGRALLRTRLARRGLALPMVLPLVIDPVPAAAMDSTCKLALSLTRAGLTPLDLVTLPAKGLKPMTALLSNKAVAATLVGAACLTLFLATRGDANASGDGQSHRSVITTVFDPSRNAEPSPVLLADAEQPATTAEEPAPADVKKEDAPAAGRPQAPDSRPLRVLRNPSEARIRATLSEQTELSFPNTPLRDALQFLADIHEINLIIDDQALEEEGLTADDDVDIVLSGITLGSALDLLLERYDLTYVIEDEVLKVTSQKRAEGKVSTQAYDVSSLVGTGGSAAEVAMVVERLIEEAPPRRVPAKEGEAAELPLPKPRVIPFQNRLLVKASAADLKRVEEILDLMWRDNSFWKKEQESRSIRHLTPGVELPAEGTSTRIFRLQNADAAAVALHLNKNIAAEPDQTSLRVAVDSRTNSIVVVGTPAQIRAAFALFSELDKEGARAGDQNGTTTSPGKEPDTDKNRIK